MYKKEKKRERESEGKEIIWKKKKRKFRKKGRKKL